MSMGSIKQLKFYLEAMKLWSMIFAGSFPCQEYYSSAANAIAVAHPFIERL
jgi:hypothetical protein